MKQRKLANAALPLGSAAYVATIIDDIFALKWDELWVILEPSVKAVCVAAVVYAYGKYIDKNRDGIPDVLQDDTADVP